MQKTTLSEVLTTLTKPLIIVLLMLPLQLTAAGSSDDSQETKSAQPLKLAERLIYKEDYAAAIKKLRATLESDNRNADAWNLLGYASRKSGDTDAAENAYQMALSIDQNHLGALEYQGELFITLDRLTDAQNNLDKLTELCPDGCEEQAELASALAKSK